jgi:hypothetical protein
MRRRILAAVLFAAILGGCGQTGAVSRHHLRVGVDRHRTPVQLVSGREPATVPAASSSPMVVFDEMPHWV